MQDQALESYKYFVPVADKCRSKSILYYMIPHAKASCSQWPTKG